MRKIVLSILIVLLGMVSGIVYGQENADKGAYSFGGHVFSGDFPISLGYAFLYDYNNDLNLIDTAVIDTLGYYYFYRKPEGRYMVMAGLSFDDPNYGHFSFTFYPNAPLWEDATIINLTATNWEYDIHLINQDNSHIGEGSGLISGNIELVDGKPFAENVDVILFDKQMQALEHWPTNSFGEFEFNHLDYGDYILYPQVIGLTTKPIYIHISENQAQFTGIKVHIKDGYIASYINEDIISSKSFICYPNPAQQQLNISFENMVKGQMNTRIYDMSGRIVYETNCASNTGINQLQINTSPWRNGLYFIEITMNNTKAIQYKFAVSH